MRWPTLREVLEQGTIVEKKEFLRGLVAGITLFLSENRGVITFYDLIPASFKRRAGSRPKLYRKIREYGVSFDCGKPAESKPPGPDEV